MILTNITLPQAGIYALLGYSVVFLGLILLMIVIILLGKAFLARSKKAAAAEKDVPLTPAAQSPETAPGSAGQLKLHNVDPKIAAMLMAITANKLGKPINELRFVSIREVEE